MRDDTLFRKVLCIERLPDEEGIYLTIRGRLLFQKGAFYDHIYSLELDATHFAPVTPNYWLEPIQLPTDEEINELCYDIYPPDNYDEYAAIRNEACKNGFKKALSILTKTQLL